MAREQKDTAIFVAYDDEAPFDIAVPEKNLLRAVLVTAMADLKKQGDPAKQATEFFLCDDSDYIFSFNSICNYLSIDPKRILYMTGLDKK